MIFWVLANLIRNRKPHTINRTANRNQTAAQFIEAIVLKFVVGEDVNEPPLSIRVFKDQFLQKIVKSDASVERVFIRHERIHSPLIHSENSLSHETDLLDFSSLFEQNVKIVSHFETV